MRDASLQITRLAGQACAQYPGGKRAVFRAIAAQAAEPKAESTFYAQFNGNASSDKALTLENLLWAMKLTGDLSPLRYMACLFGYSLVSLDSAEPDAPTVEAEMLQDYPALVALHEAVLAYGRGEISFETVLARMTVATNEIIETVAKAKRQVK